MTRNTSVIIGEHFSDFIDEMIQQGRFESKSEAVRAGLRLLEDEEKKLDILRARLLDGEQQLARGEGVDGEGFMNGLIG